MGHFFWLPRGRAISPISLRSSLLQGTGYGLRFCLSKSPAWIDGGGGCLPFTNAVIFTRDVLMISFLAVSLLPTDPLYPFSQTLQTP